MAAPLGLRHGRPGEDQGCDNDKGSEEAFGRHSSTPQAHYQHTLQCRYQHAGAAGAAFPLSRAHFGEDACGESRSLKDSGGPLDVTLWKAPT